MHLPVHKYFNMPEKRHVKVIQPEQCCLGQQQIFFLPVFYFQQQGYIIFHITSFDKHIDAATCQQLNSVRTCSGGCTGYKNIFFLSLSS